MGIMHVDHVKNLLHRKKRIKKNEEASCESAGGNLFQIHCTSGIVWYCGVGFISNSLYQRYRMVLWCGETAITLLWNP